MTSLFAHGRNGRVASATPWPKQWVITRAEVDRRATRHRQSRNGEEMPWPGPKEVAEKRFDLPDDNSVPSDRVDDLEPKGKPGRSHSTCDSEGHDREPERLERGNRSRHAILQTRCDWRASRHNLLRRRERLQPKSACLLPRSRLHEAACRPKIAG